MEIINHVAILLDKSSSMASLRDQVIAQFNQQVTKLTELTTTKGQKTLLSLYTFQTSADQPLLVEVPLDLVQIKPLTGASYIPAGMTAMNDSIELAIGQLSRFERGSNDAFLVIVITDGQENASRVTGWVEVANLIRTKTSTDMWSFVFLVPAGQKAELLRKLPVADGNVQEWDQTVAGVKAYSTITSQGLDGFYGIRGSGAKSTTSFFKTDLANVTPGKVHAALHRVHGFKKGIVTISAANGSNVKGQKTVLIQDFCEKEFGEYSIGRAFYELTKREKVQEGKKIVLEDRTTGGLFTGDNTRSILGLGSNGPITVTPGDHGKWRIFIQSTSVNRKLLAGTEVLYRTSN